jgi:hypothetical protein
MPNLTDPVPDLVTRPKLCGSLSEAEFTRWYWLKVELAEFARSLGIRATGSKDLLAARVAAKLGRREFAEPQRSRTIAGRQLAGELTPDTVIPAGQRSSQVVRVWMSEQVRGFHFDAEMRAFFAASDGTKTLQDAVDHWHTTRGGGPKQIGNQFEYNRFTRAWNDAHPDTSRDVLLAAWGTYRHTPLDQRDRI